MVKREQTPPITFKDVIMYSKEHFLPLNNMWDLEKIVVKIKAERPKI